MKIRNPLRRRVARDLFRALALLSACMFALSLWSAFGAKGSPAGAATSSGEVTLSPASGNSGTVFAFTFAGTPECAGDTATGGYNWSSFMIPASADPGAMSMTPNGPNQVSGEYRASFLASPNGETVAMQATNIAGGAGQPGLITGIPQFTFEFNLPGEVPAGDYLVGVACTKNGGQLVDTYYSRTMTVTVNAAAGGPAQIDWAQAAGGGTTTTTADVGTTTTTADGGTTTTTADGGTTTTTADGGTTTTSAGGTTTTGGASVFSGGSPSAASPVTTAGQLPYTGSSPVPMVVWAIALLVFGRMAMLLGKRPKVVDGPGA